jgi:hypothetical protein
MKNAFEEDEKIPEMNSGLKIKNKNQTLKSSPSSLEEDAYKLVKNKNEINVKIAELSAKYMSFVRDKTITDNKSANDTSNEKAVINNLINLCLALNADETEPEGIGSIGLCSLLSHAILEQRNIINDLKYEIHKLKLDNKANKKSENDK